MTPMDRACILKPDMRVLRTISHPLLVKIGFFCLVFGAGFFLFYHQASSKYNYISDLPGHLSYWQTLATDPLSVPHPLFHILVGLTSLVSGISLHISAAFVLACLTTSLALIIFFILKDACHGCGYTDVELLFVTFLMMTVSSAFIPGVVSNMYLGQGSPNVWHSATLLTVKPIAFLAVFLLFNRPDEHRGVAHYSATCALIILSILAKPSFIFVFLPSIWLFSALKGLLRLKPFLIFLLILSLTSLLVVGLQYYSVYHEGSVYAEQKATVVFDFLGVWSRYTRSVPVSIVLGIAFPLAVALANPRRVYENDALLLCWLMTLCGIVMGTTLAETGARYHHGNFIWSYRLAQQFVFVYSMAEFLKWDRQSTGRSWYAIIIAALSLHIISGMIYTVRIWSGDFYY